MWLLKEHGEREEVEERVERMYKVLQKQYGTDYELKVMILVYLVQASCNTRTLVPQLSGQWFC